MNRTSLANGFNTMGIVSCYVQWMWVVLVCLPSILQSDLLQNDAPSQGVATQESIASSLVDSLGPFQAIVGVIIIVITIILTVYAIKRSQHVVQTSSKQVIDVTADQVIPVLTHHKKVSKRKRVQLTARVKFFLQSIMCLLPFLVLPFTALLPVRSIDMGVVLTVGVILLPWGFIWFLLARLFDLDHIKPGRKKV